MKRIFMKKDYYNSRNLNTANNYVNSRTFSKYANCTVRTPISTVVYENKRYISYNNTHPAPSTFRK